MGRPGGGPCYGKILKKQFLIPFYNFSLVILLLYYADSGRTDWVLGGGGVGGGVLLMGTVTGLMAES